MIMLIMRVSSSNLRLCSRGHVENFAFIEAYKCCKEQRKARYAHNLRLKTRSFKQWDAWVGLRTFARLIPAQRLDCFVFVRTTSRVIFSGGGSAVGATRVEKMLRTRMLRELRLGALATLFEARVLSSRQVAHPASSHV